MTAKKRVSPSAAPIDLELITVAIRPRLGGMTSWFEQIARGLTSRGWKIRWIALTDRVEDADDSLGETIHLPLSPPTSSLLSPLEKWNRWRGIYNLWKAKNLTQPRLRLSDGTPGVLQFASRLHRETGTTWAVLMGGNVFEETENQFLSSLLHRRIRSSLLNADRILVDGEDLVDRLESAGVPRDKLTVQYHGIDLEVFRSAPRTRFFPEPSEDPRLRLVWHGRLAENHGPDRFLEVASMVPNSIARMCGGGDLSPELKDRLATDAAKKIYLGRLPYSELVGLLNEANCGVYPLRGMAGIPTVLLESMAAGNATITLKTGASESLIQNGANGFALNTMDELIDCAGSLSSNEELRKRVGIEARATIERDWSADATTRKLEKIFEELSAR